MSQLHADELVDYHVHVGTFAKFQDMCGGEGSGSLFHAVWDELRQVSFAGALRLLLGRFAAGVFAVALFIVSLQFMKNVRQAVDETARVLKIIAMLLNPVSIFYLKKQAESDSYVHRIRHADPYELGSAIKEQFAT